MPYFNRQEVRKKSIERVKSEKKGGVIGHCRPRLHKMLLVDLVGL